MGERIMSREYNEIRKELIEHQNKVDELIKEMEEEGYGIDFSIDLGSNYAGCFPSRELGEERVCVIYKGYYYTKDQCWRGDNDITIFEYGASSIGNAVKEFFKDFGTYLEKDELIKDGKKVGELIDNMILSCDQELMECFRKELFKNSGK
jgi:hypothetical protein